MSQYKCKICNYSTKKFMDITKHINKKKLCYDKNDKSLFNISKDEILVCSIIPFFDNKQNIHNFDNINEINKNKESLFNLLFQINKNKIKQCPNCNTTFNKLNDLKNHLILKCFMDNINKNNILDNNFENISLNSHNNTNNSINTNTNNINSNNITNNNTNNNITIQIKSPIPFDDDWITSHINPHHLQNFLFSKKMYTNLLTEILENEINLNVIIDKKNNDDIGWIYKNDDDKYIMMNIKDIVNNSMNKLFKKLNELNHKEIHKSDIESDFLQSINYNINNKFQTFSNDTIVNNHVNNLISNIFYSKKDEALEISNKIDKDKSIEFNF